MSKYTQGQEEQRRKVAALAETGHGAPMIRVLEATSPGLQGAHCLQAADGVHYVSVFGGGALLSAEEITRWEALGAVRVGLLDELEAAVGTDDLPLVVGKLLENARALGYWVPAAAREQAVETGSWMSVWSQEEGNL